MSLIRTGIRSLQDAPAPDPIVRAAVASLVAGAARRLEAVPTAEADFIAGMQGRPVAEHVQAANDQHYELPPAFFETVLGPRLKYSSCLYPTGEETLAEAILGLANDASLRTLHDQARRQYAAAHQWDVVGARAVTWMSV